MNTQHQDVTAQSIPAGYKQTEVGVIPEDWEVISIRDALEGKYILDQMDGNHGELYPKSHEFSQFGIPYIGANDFSMGVVNYKSCKYLPEKRAKKFKKGIAKNGDVLFAHNATVGPVALLETNYEFLILSTTATYYRCNPSKILNKFLAKYFESKFFYQQYSAVMSQSTRNQVPILAQRKFKIIIPSLIEQTAIANALSDVDTLIQELEKLIAKKRDIKAATMQQLLTGRTRLPQFAYRADGTKKGTKASELGEIPEDWEVINLLDKVSLLHGKAHEPYVSEAGEHTVVNSKFISTEGSVQKFCTKNLCQAKPYDVLMVLSDLPTGKALAKCFYVLEENMYAVNQRICIFRPTSIHAKLVFYILNRHKYFLNLDDGVTQTHILNNDISGCQIYLPTEKSEQTAIATILTDMDSEIQTLEQRLAKTRQLKQGMMQELLTGRTRLVKPNPVN